MITFAKAVKMFKPPKDAPAAWSLKGLQVFGEFYEVVVQSGSDLDVYFAQWASTSDISECSAAFHEGKQIFEFIKSALTIDQLDGINSLCLERAARRFIEIQGAVRRNPKHPDFTGLSHGTAGMLDECGAVRASGCHEWLLSSRRSTARNSSTSVSTARRSRLRSVARPIRVEEAAIQAALPQISATIRGVLGRIVPRGRHRPPHTASATLVAELR